MIKRFIKRHIKKLVLAYIVGLPVGNMLTIPLTTNIPFHATSTILKTALSHPINSLTYGTITPAVSGLEKGVGHILNSIGDTVESDTMQKYGNGLLEKGSKWFDLTVDNVANGSKNETATHNSNQNSSSQSNRDGVSKTKSEQSKNNATSKTETKHETSKNTIDEWSFEKYPDYYKVIGKSNIDANNFPSKGKFEYTPVDSLGRATYAKGTITYDIVSVTGDRQKIPAKVVPSGWGHQGKVSIPYLNDKVYSGYMYNKSHMIADSLGGEPIASNLVTGTRTQNVGYNGKGGMAYSESKVRDYFKSHKNEVVYYEVTSHFEGDELLPRYSIVNFMSSDKSLDESVVVYNYANGYNINYSDGTFTKKS